MKIDLKWVVANAVALLFTATAHAITFEMVSLTTADVPPTATPQYTDAQAAVTPDGRYVVFEGSYGGLVTGPTSPFLSGGYSQIYLRDRVAGTTELISQSTAGVVANTTDNDLPTISNDGCRVVFESWATNLIDGYDFGPNGSRHVFLRDRCAPGGPTTTQVDVMPNGSPGMEQAIQPRISGDGRTVVFTSYSDLVAGLLTHGGGTCTGSPGYNVVYYRRLDLNTTTALTRPDGGCIEGNSPDVSYDGTRIVFYSEAQHDLLNGNTQKWQIYLFDTSIGPRSLSFVSAAANGAPQRYIADAPSEGYVGLTAPAISQNGRIVAFRSSVYGLWPSSLPQQGGALVNQVYVKDTYTGAIHIASVDSTGTVFGNKDSSSGGRPGLSADGQYIVFRTSATNIAPASETGSGFVIHNNVSGKTSGFTNVETNGYPELSPNGRFVTIHSGNYMDVRFSDRGMFLLDLGDPANPTRLINISTRGQVSTGDGVMIGGFIISGTANKKVLIRAIGPTLANFGISGTLPDPKLELYEGATLIGSNDNWQTQAIAADVAAITATGLAPANVAESALLVTLKPGVAYTAVVTGVNVPSGVGIVEVFEADHPEYQLINISTRGRVQTGEGVMIGGFIIQGDAPKTVLVRAVGPNLANFGVSGVLADPMMEIYRSSDGVKIASNDDWQTQTIAADVSAITATGLPPADPRESAILLTLPPGAYTAVVSGKNGGTGVGIVEVFAR